MEDKANKLAFDKDKDNNFIYNFFKNISTFKKLAISVIVPGYLSYRLLSRKSLYSEHHSHFNSPNRVLNQKLTEFHMQDAFVRFGIGFVFLYGFLTIIKNNFQGYEYENLMIDFGKQKENKSTKFNEIDNKFDIIIDDSKENLEKTFKFKDHADQELLEKAETLFDLNEDKRSRNVVNKYLNININK